MKKFSQRSSLNIHKRIHTGRFPFSIYLSCIHFSCCLVFDDLSCDIICFSASIRVKFFCFLNYIDKFCGSKNLYYCFMFFKKICHFCTNFFLLLKKQNKQSRIPSVIIFFFTFIFVMFLIRYGLYV